MRWTSALAVTCALLSSIRAEEPAKANTLTPKEIADGWIMLFDGESTFGWKIDGDANVRSGVFTLGGSKATTAITSANFFSFEYSLEYAAARTADTSPTVQMVTGEKKRVPNKGISNGSYHGSASNPKSGPIRFEIPAKCSVEIRTFRIRPLRLEPLFNGKDLTGWKQFTDNPKQAKSKFTVTPEGWLNIKDGPGDLQTEKQFEDFVLQFDCISNGKNLNSGLFFRCLPGQYQQGYEAQIQNGFKDTDRTKPVDFGTGAIYRRQPARKVVSNDHEWFTMTVIAQGNHIATWVNGYQVTDFTDDRKPSENARNGSKTGKGALSIQGHDPTTNLSFRNIRIAELPKR